MRRVVSGLLASALFVAAQTPKHDLRPNAEAEAVRVANNGLAEAHKENYKAAIQDYKRAVALDPDLPGLYLNLGLAWFKLGNFTEAAKAFEQANRKTPSEQGSTLLAMSEFGLGRYREASARLASLAAANPDNTELGYWLAKCYLWSGQYKAATDLVHSIIERHPDSAAVHMLLGEAYDADDRTPEAIAEYQAAVQADPNEPTAHFGLGYLFWKVKHYDDAEAQFREQLRKVPDDPKALAFLADVLLRNGRADEAEADLKRAIAGDKHLVIAHVDLGTIYADKKNAAAAIEQLREAVTEDPKRYDAHYKLARLYRELGRTQQADAEFAIVAKLHEEQKPGPLMKVSGPQ